MAALVETAGPDDRPQHRLSVWVLGHRYAGPDPGMRGARGRPVVRIAIVGRIQRISVPRIDRPIARAFQLATVSTLRAYFV